MSKLEIREKLTFMLKKIKMITQWKVNKTDVDKTIDKRHMLGGRKSVF